MIQIARPWDSSGSGNMEWKKVFKSDICVGDLVLCSQRYAVLSSH
uniref:Uncharacterized protein n=1 Tax=Anguilla anguilla TaxID=7936 RepID=A0A0E9R8Q4_ANGAN